MITTTLSNSYYGKTNKKFELWIQTIYNSMIACIAVNKTLPLLIHIHYVAIHMTFSLITLVNILLFLQYIQQKLRNHFSKCIFVYFCIGGGCFWGEIICVAAFFFFCFVLLSLMFELIVSN